MVAGDREGRILSAVVADVFAHRRGGVGFRAGSLPPSLESVCVQPALVRGWNADVAAGA